MSLYFTLLRMTPGWVSGLRQRTDAYYNELHRDADKHESKMIAPTPKLVTMMYRTVFEPLISCLQGLDKNISFLTAPLGADLTWFVINCDWCSVSNGIIHTAVENIQRQPELAHTIDERPQAMIAHLRQALSQRQTQVGPDDIRSGCQRMFGSESPPLLMITELYLLLEQVELRWCPFKRSRELYYRNLDPRYITPVRANIIAVGRALASRDTVDCRECPGIVNAALEKNMTVRPSLFQPFLDLMRTRINAQPAAVPRGTA